MLCVLSERLCDIIVFVICLTLAIASNIYRYSNCWFAVVYYVISLSSYCDHCTLDYYLVQEDFI